MSRTFNRNIESNQGWSIMTFVITKEQMKGIPKPTKKDLDNIMNVLTNIDIGFG